MEEDRIKWNDKYRYRLDVGKPCDLVMRFTPTVQNGRACDLACGLGRHALFLAERGFQVDAIDISDEALGRLSHPKVHTIHADLDTFHFQPNVYQIAVCTYFLDRRLWPSLGSALKEGGLLLFETYLMESDRIETAQFKLQPGELEAAFADWHLLHYAEKDGTASMAALRK